MRVRNLSRVMGIAVGLMACSRTSITISRDAAVEAAPPSDVLPPGTDSVPSDSDAGNAVPDAAGVPDTAALIPDAAVVPDSAAAPDAAVVPDTAVLIPDVVVVPDTAVLVPDSAAVLPDAAGPDAAEAGSSRFANRTFRIDTANPAPTPAASCTQYGPADYFRLTFSSDASSVTVLGVKGSAATTFHAAAGPESDRLTYHVSDFLAGGVIFIERDQGIYVAQVVLYGSGVPIAWCLRGAMTPQP